MPIGRYRLTVVGCALSWLLVGMHLPMLRHMMDDRHSHDWLVLTLTALLVVVGIRRLDAAPFSGLPDGPVGDERHRRVTHAALRHPLPFAT